SPYGHARVEGISRDKAVGMPGVVAVLTLDDLRQVLTSDVVAGGMPTAAIRHEIYRPVLADKEVVYVGEAVALVVAATQQEAEDAAEVVEVDYEPLPSVVDARLALEEGAARVHEALKDNCLA